MGGEQSSRGALLVDEEAFPACDGVRADHGVDRLEGGADVVRMSARARKMCGPVAINNTNRK